MEKTYVLRHHIRPFAGIACLLARSMLISGCTNQNNTDESEPADTTNTTETEIIRGLRRM